MKPRRPSAFQQRDLTKALKAVAAAGLCVVGVKVSADGKIEVVTTGAGENPPSGGNEWDRV